jgi:hypothetical protein
MAYDNKRNAELRENGMQKVDNEKIDAEHNPKNGPKNNAIKTAKRQAECLQLTRENKDNKEKSFNEFQVREFVTKAVELVSSLPEKGRIFHAFVGAGDVSIKQIEREALGSSSACGGGILSVDKLEPDGAHTSTKN